MRNVLIRKFQASNYSIYEKAFDSCLLNLTANTIVFFYVAFTVDITLRLILIGACAGFFVFVARFAFILGVAKGNAAVASVLQSTFSIWQTLLAFIFLNSHVDFLQVCGLVLGFVSLVMISYTSRK